MARDVDSQLIEAMRQLYQWLDSAINEVDTDCKACGRCCDFAAYDHRLFITTPELIYFTHHQQPEELKPMPAGICPYRIDGRCTVYNSRFAGCRIFHCTGDADQQSQLTEQTLEKLKAITIDFQLEYQYTELSKALHDE